MSADWLSVQHGTAPLIVSIPHAGTEIPADIASHLTSLQLARYDADRYVHHLYAFAEEMGATIVRTAISRTVIDVNRDPTGRSLYPGQVTTGLCPETTFDGEPFYRPGTEPDGAEIARRRAAWFDPYHLALAEQIDRLRLRHARVVLYEAHSIRSVVPRLFDGELPVFNIGTYDDTACDPALTRAVEAVCAASGEPFVTNGRFKGGWTTRHYGRPQQGVHALQMELAMRAYLDEVPFDDWPPPWDPQRAAVCQTTLRQILAAALDFARNHP